MHSLQLTLDPKSAPLQEHFKATQPHCMAPSNGSKAGVRKSERELAAPEG